MSEDKDALFIKNAKLVLNKFGVKAADLEKADVNVAEIVENTALGIVENRKGDIEVDARKAAQTAAYAKLEKQLVSAFGLDAAKYASLQKGQLDAILADAKALVADKPEAPANSKGGDFDTLKKQYSELDAQYKAALKEAGELKAEKEQLPSLLAKERKNVKIGYEKEAAISSAIKVLREKGLSPNITDKMIKAEIFSDGIDLEAIENGDNIAFRVAQKIAKSDGTTEYKPIKKSESEAYNSLADFAIDKVIKEDMIIKSNNPTGGNAGANLGNGNTGASGDAGKLDLSKIPPALRQQYNLG
jgi:hypothetical protein